MSKKKKEQHYTVKLLEACKSWGGPCSSAIQIETAMKSHTGKVGKNYDNGTWILSTHTQA